MENSKSKNIVGLRLYRLPSSWGEWTVGFTDKGLAYMSFPKTPPKTQTSKETKLSAPKHPILKIQEGKTGKQFIQSMTARMAGKKTDFPFEKIDLEGTTKFQKTVWKKMYSIPYGKKKSYGELAKMAGYPKAARAVGNVCNANRVPFLIPCHRVFASNGIGGFGAGLPWKRFLLKEEGFIL